LPQFDAALEPAWQEHLATAQTPTGEKLTPYSPYYQPTRDAFEAGRASRNAEIEALRADLDRALGVTVPEPAVVAAPVVEPETLSSERDREVAAKVLRAAADEARDIERIGQTPYASILTSEAEQFNAHPLSNLYRAEDTRAHITWLDSAADAALAGVLPHGA